MKWLAGFFDLYGALAFSFALAAFFGLVRYLQEFLGAGEKPAFKWLIAGAKVMTAGAVGLAVHWLLAEWKVGENYGAFLTAIAGYGGAETLNAMKEAALDAIRRKASGSSGPEAKG